MCYEKRDAEIMRACRERDELNAELQKVIAKLHEVKSERDALLSIVKNWGECEHCKHADETLPGDGCEPGSQSCYLCTMEKIACCKCATGDEWEWKGIKKGGSDMKDFIQVFGRRIELTEEQAKALQEQYAPPSVKLAEVPVGETFLIGSHEFVVLEQFADSAAVILKGLLHESMEFGQNNNFDGSDADEACGEFAGKIAGIIGAENLMEHTVDLTSDDGLKDYGVIQRKVSLLTAALYRKYVEVLDEQKLSRWQWLATPQSTKRHENDRWVKCVSPSGNLIYDYYNSDIIGVRPFCILKSHIFVSK